jgi:hypothetical protein
MSEFINWLKEATGIDLSHFANWLKTTIGLELSDLFLIGILLLMAIELLILVMRRSRKAKGVLLYRQSKKKR